MCWDKFDVNVGGNFWFVVVDDKGMWFECGIILVIYVLMLVWLLIVGVMELGLLVFFYLDVVWVMICNEDGCCIIVMVGGVFKGGLLDGVLMVLCLIGLWFFLLLIVVILLVMLIVIYCVMCGVCCFV